MTQTIEILVTRDGKTSIQTQGFAGSTCRDASKFLEEALGQRASERLTAEFHQGQTNHLHQQQ
ncbi:MAG: DUF2997 domain-containing protein [Rhodopirellula sp.]|nr:DUF2997 domain-containing protein [Rhodopirellula sp.]